MSSPEAKIIDRLHEIAARTHWRHVFRIAASKAFALAELAHLRRQIIHVCDALDHGDLSAAYRAIGAGAFLALDLLLDNVAGRLPDLKRSLVTRALKILDLGSKAVPAALATYLDRDTLRSFEAEIFPRLSDTEGLSAGAAWKLMLIISNEVSSFRQWADQALTDRWPTDAKKLLALIVSSEIAPVSEQILDRLRLGLIEAGSESTRAWKLRMYRSDMKTPLAFDDLFEFLNACPDYRSITYRDKAPTSLRFSIVPLATAAEPRPKEISQWPHWAEAFIASEFQDNPNQKTQASAIRKIGVLEKKVFRLGQFPWPLASALATIRMGQDYNDFAEAAEAGNFGDTADWREAEQRWFGRGITLDDVLTWRDGAFISHSIATIGAPIRP
jgi:hypothetical protein